MKVDIKELVELGMSLKFSHKDSLDSWYGEVGFSYLKHDFNYCCLTNTPFYNLEIKSIEDGLYLFFAYIKHWKNLAYSIDRIRKIEPDFFDEGYDDEDVALIKEEQEKVKEEWNKEFDIVKLKNILKNNNLFDEVFVKEYVEDDED